MSGAHGHFHDHDLGDLGDTRLRRGLTVVVVVALAFALVGVAVWWPRGEAPELNPGGLQLQFVDATVTAVDTQECVSLEVPGAAEDCQTVIVDVTSGETAGEEASFRIQASDFSKPELEVGDRVVLARNPAAPVEFQYSYADQQRSVPLVALLVLFVIVVVVLGRWKGLRALAGIGLGLAVIVAFLLPALLRGSPALPVALAGTVVIAVVVLYFAHGVRPATTVALVGTLASLLVTAVLAQVFVGLSSFTGLFGEAAQTLRITADAVDLRALLVAGIVIGALGVLDDVTVTQVAAVTELRRVNPDLSRIELYRAAVNVGRDHIASVVNTLVLAYAGASLPLLLVFLQGERPWDRAVTSELVAIEIVRTLVGSIGLVVAVPITTGLAAAALSTAPEAPPSGPDPRDQGPLDLLP